MSTDPAPADSLASIWLRRAVSWTMLALLSSVVWGLLPAWLLLAVLLDVAFGRLALPVTRTTLVVAVYLACEVLGLAGAGVVFLRTVGKRSDAVREANAALQGIWGSTLFHAIRILFSMPLHVEAAERGSPAPYLLLVRHSSTADTLLAAALLAWPHRIVLRYVLKRELLWDPCLDIVGRRLPNAFVERTGDAREAQLKAVASLAENLDARSGVLIYPEGTRFSEAKRDRAIRKLEEEGKHELADLARSFTHVLPPRLGGTLTLLERMRGQDVVFLDHAGFEGARAISSLVRGAFVRQPIWVRLRRVRGADVPTEHLDVWLFRQWQETNQWVVDHAPKERQP